MPFGDVGKGEFGTYFIGYARSPSRIEQMLENMFIGQPPGNYDRLLDVSRAVTGSLFFVPPAPFLDDAASDDAAASDDVATAAATPSSAAADASESMPRRNGFARWLAPHWFAEERGRT